MFVITKSFNFHAMGKSPLTTFKRLQTTLCFDCACVLRLQGWFLEWGKKSTKCGFAVREPGHSGDMHI
jgi:hypothetical protein